MDFSAVELSPDDRELAVESLAEAGIDGDDSVVTLGVYSVSSGAELRAWITRKISTAGAAINPELTLDTPVSALGANIDLTSGLKITQGTQTAVADFSSSKTIGDMINEVKSLNLGVMFQREGAVEAGFGVVQVPMMLPRLFEIAGAKTTDAVPGRHVFVLLEDLIAQQT